MPETLDQPERLDLASMDVARKKQAEILRLFPEVRTEGGRIDFDRLRIVLGAIVDVGKERYGMNWPGKADCLRTIQIPSVATLMPLRDESLDWDTTENVIIEGDNLEVLKLLQKSYLGKVKMIYIDPPYNTGGDFVYPDNFSESLQTYLEYTGQVDTQGRRFSTNVESDGRFHTKWMNMMYSRLYLARQLLSEDGVIFISIGDDEAENLRKLFDEIFGEENFINTVSVNMKNIAGASGGGEDKRLKKNVEFLHIYARNYDALKPFQKAYDYVPIDELLLQYRDEGTSWKYTSVLTDAGSKRFLGETVDGEGNAIKIFARENSQIKSVGQLVKETGLDEAEVYRRYAKTIFQTAMPQSSIRPRVMEKCKDLGFENDLCSIEYVPRSGKNKGVTYEQFYKGDNYRLLAWLGDVTEERDGKLVKKELQGTYWDFASETKNLTKEGDIPFPNGKKPVALIERMLELVGDQDALVLDFFAGSGSTGHAVLAKNSADGGNRRFVMVQLPERLDPAEDDQAASAQLCDELGRPRNVAELTKERIRRVVAKMRSQTESVLDFASEGKRLDLGFRVFRLSTSNFIPWDGTAANDVDQLAKQLQLGIDHTRADRSAEDLLFEVLLKSWGEPALSLNVHEELVEGAKVFSIAEGAFLICLEEKVSLELIRVLASRKPDRVVMRESAFAGNDQLKANAVQTYRAQGVTSFKVV